EHDPLTIDPNAWADYWASLKVDAVLLNGGGIVAFYPTQVPYHHRSEFLGTRDLLGEMVAAMKRRGMRAVARMDCNFAYEEAVKAHPEWFERNRDGSLRPHAESPWLFSTCMFSTYFTEQMAAIYREINQHYPVDGFFTNGWPSAGALRVCHCENCRRVFDRLGGVPPDETDASNPLYRKYYQVYLDRVSEVWRLWDQIAHERSPQSVYVGNLGGGLDTVKDLKEISQVSAWFNADHQGRSGETPIWVCAQQGRVANSVMQGRTITNVAGAYANAQPNWRHVSKSSAELTMWLAQTTASGMVPWLHWLGGSPEDTRWRETGHSFFAWIAANESHFRNRHSVADLAVLYPQRTIAFYSRPDSRKPRYRGGPTDYLQGLYYALLEGRFVFDFVHESNLDPAALKKYRALLIPNAAYLGDRQCDTIRKYVNAGGSLLATFETSRYDEWGNLRPDFQLADIFGAHVAGEVVGPRGNSYARIESRHPVLDGFQGTSLLPGAENRLPIRAASSQLVLSVVPNYPAFPPETVYPRTPHTTEPAAVFREIGNSRIAYFAGDVDRTCWRSGDYDLSHLLQNAVSWIRGGDPLVSITGAGLLELFAWQTELGYALHLLNYTNPNATHGYIRSSYPLAAQQVRFRTDGRAIRSVRALRAETVLKFEQREDFVTFKLPGFGDYEVVALT
ncbi:MAG TPA: alpha-amylase family protein, partial [Terriglobales bacterium]|nr:alpha-amylase family protein [Terriglobales bacterium]